MNIGNITSDNFNLDGNGKDIQIEVYEQLIEQLQQENLLLKENAENNDKVVDKVNWENMLLKKKYENAVADYESVMFEKEQLNSLVNSCQEEIRQLKKQLEEYQKELEKADSITQSCIFNGKEESKISYRKCLNILDKKETQQKEFIKYLENGIDICDGFLDTVKSDLQEISYRVMSANKTYITTQIKENEIAHKVYEEILQKYKEIIGGKE